MEFRSVPWAGEWWPTVFTISVPTGWAGTSESGVSVGTDGIIVARVSSV